MNTQQDVDATADTRLLDGRGRDGEPSAHASPGNGGDDRDANATPSTPRTPAAPTTAGTAYDNALPDESARRYRIVAEHARGGLGRVVRQESDAPAGAVQAASGDEVMREEEDPAMQTGGFRNSTPEEILVREFDQALVAITVVPCFHAEPAYMKQVAHMSEVADMFVVDYTRSSQGSLTTIRDVDVVVTHWKDPRLERCLETALEGVSWYDDGLKYLLRELPGEREWTVGVPHGILRHYLHEIRPRKDR